MYKLLDELLEGQEYDTTEAELEKAIGAGQGLISHQRKVESDLSFVHTLKAVRFLSKHNELEKMKEFIGAFTKEDNLRVSLEYSLSIRDFDLCETLLEQLTEIGKVKNIDWVKTYKIALAFQKREIGQQELSCMLQSHTPKHLETRVLTNILKCYMYFYRQKWVDIKELVPEIECDMKNIKNDYLKSTFNVRLKELLAHINLHYYNNPQQARKNIEEITQAEFSFMFNLHVEYIKAKTYMLENFDKALDHFNKYIRDLENVGDYSTAERVRQQDVSFLKCYWNKDLDTVETKNLPEQIHLEIKRGNKELANALIEELEKQQELSPFQKYYKGMLNNTPELLMESMLEFIKNGDYFYSQLPKNLLKEFPVFNVTAEMVYNKFVEKGELCS